MRKKLIIHTFTDEMYSITYVIVCGGWKEFTSYVRRRWPETYRDLPQAAGADGLFCGEAFPPKADGTRAVHIIYIFPGPGKEEALLHEVLHATLQTMDLIGHPVDVRGSEPVAHYQQWLMREARKRLRW